MRLRVALMALVAFLAAACGPARANDAEQVGRADRIVFKFAHVVAENTPKGLAARRFATLMKERTSGRVEVQVFPNSQLYRDGEELDALRSDEVQFIAPSLSKLEEVDPLWQVFDLPYLFADQAAVDRVIAGTTGERLYANLRRQGIEPLAFWDNGFKVMTNNLRPLLVPTDARGMRFRIQPSQVTRDAFTAVGVDVSVQSFDALYGLLARGELDGQENSPSNIYSKRVHEVQKYMTLSNHGYLGYVILTNQRFWNRLPPALRETVRLAMADTTEWVRENAAVLNEESMLRIAASGRVTIHTPTVTEQEQWRTAMQSAYRRAEDRLGAEAVRTVLREARTR